MPLLSFSIGDQTIIKLTAIATIPSSIAAINTMHMVLFINRHPVSKSSVFFMLSHPPSVFQSLFLLFFSFFKEKCIFSPPLRRLHQKTPLRKQKIYKIDTCFFYITCYNDVDILLGGFFVDKERTVRQPKRRRPNAAKARHMWLSGLFSPVFFAISFAYMELVFHIREFQNASALFPILFAVPLGILAGAVCNLFSEKVARILRYVFAIAPAVLFGVQLVYFHSFQSFMSISQTGMGGDVFTNFFKTIMLAIWECMIPILLMFVPTAGVFCAHKWFNPRRKFNLKRTMYNVSAFLLVQLLVMLLLPLGGTGEHSAYANFNNNWVLDLSMEKLGLFTTTAMDVKYFFFGDALEPEGVVEDVPEVFIPVDVPDETEPQGPIEYGDNVITGLDFAALAETETNKTTKKILNYLASVEPTKKNEYTGMFKGYNLILITAESFSPMGIHEELTPTLYKLAHSGFDFTNYWTTFPSNTTNGEYVHLTGLMPDLAKPKSNGSFVYSIRNTMNMNIANWFNAQGLTSRAYHDHTATYYKRNQTHPNIGYVFEGKGTIGGLKGWPESDLVMMEKTVDDYINDDWFHTYYMTVSGHHNYRFGGYNSMVEKNKDLVKNLKMGDSAKAYIATHIELDRALEYLIKRLEEAGKLDKTVIALASDHYPYGLTDTAYKNMLGHKLKYGSMERYCSELIIWNSAMETITIDKPCSSPDVLPTLLNLFGFEYDSRIYSGCDILSDSYGLALISNQSFVTDKIVYNSRYEKAYLLDEEFEVTKEYKDTYIQIVKNRFSIAASMLTNNFFSRLPKDVIAAAQRGDNNRTLTN